MKEKHCEWCGQRYWFDHPYYRFLVTDLEYPEDEHDSVTRKFCGVDAGEAVERWAEDEDAYGDYQIVSGGEGVVRVQKVDKRGKPDGDPKKMRVTGEAMPVYTAREVD